jgi:hypothetical protein
MQQLEQQKLLGMPIKHFMLANEKDLPLVHTDQLNSSCIRALHVSKDNRVKYDDCVPTITQSESNKTI